MFRFLSVLLLGTLVQTSQADSPSIEFKTTASGVKYAVTKQGTGEVAKPGYTIMYRMIETLEDGTVLRDGRSSVEPDYTVAGEERGLTKGFQQGLELLSKGDQAVIVVPWQLGYGDQAQDKVPAYATLHYTVDVVDIKPHRITHLLFEEIHSRGLKAAGKMLQRLKASRFDDTHISARSLPYLAYGYLYRYNDVTTAIQLCQWNLELYPDDSQSLGYLADGYFLSGNRQAAIENYKRIVDSGALRAQPRDLKRATEQLVALNSNPQSPTRYEVAQIYLDRAPAMSGMFEDVALNMAFLGDQVERYIANLRNGDEGRAAELVTKFIDLADADRDRLRESLYKQFSKKTALKEVNRAIELSKQADEMLVEAKKGIASTINDPMKWSFKALDGRNVDLEALRGKVVLLQFWAAWGQASTKAIPGLKKIYDEYHSKGLEIIGISMDASPELATAADVELKRVRTAKEVFEYTQANDMSWPQYYEGRGLEQNSMANKYLVRMMPKAVLLDRDGRFVETVFAQQLEKAVGKLMQ